MNNNAFALTGTRRLVFDGHAWEQTGHDIGDNSCFWKPATVVRVYERRGEWLADVRFDGMSEDEVSRGHFVDRFREVR